VLDWTPLVDLVRRHHRFLLTTHVRPDGDGLGSMLALADVLELQGKETQLVIASTLPPRYQFLIPADRISRFDPAAASQFRPDMTLVLDTGTWNQLGDFGPYLRSMTVPKAVIDHHLTQDDLGATRFVNVKAEATGRLIFELIGALGGPLTQPAANALFVALAMDTGWFHHSNTTAATFDLASDLAAAGAEVNTLYQHLYEENTLSRLKLMGLVLERLHVTQGGHVAYSEIYSEDYVTTGAVPQDTEDLVNFTLSLAGVEVGLLFLEQPRGGVKVSLRSRAQVDVARVAEQFGGGGHRQAAGATLSMSVSDAQARVLTAVATAVSAAVSPRQLPASPRIPTN
jgi:bifunctional oligoribonuclease and PAP phosphatase NrnA